MMNPTDHHDDETRYGLTPLGREALAEAIGDAIAGSTPPALASAGSPGADPLPLRRIRRTRTRVRALVRAAGRRS